ncbi:ANK1 [Symbiodinium pilosum]|uniref:ANK1 protein n=1 Tax=Symbiodinium pilosum TaxID=2952 RepID=A0A812Y5H4_SYMPI|nr:ANK1 [Symbiodinium pilosum]
MSIAGGVSWEGVLLPLRHISEAWIWTTCFIIYISFTYFAVLNVVTAVFCNSAIESAQNDHATVVQNMLDNKESHLKKLRALFSKFDIQENGGITYGMFEEKLDSPAVREYFETLGLDVWDSWSFFKLLDQDGGGLVEVEEFFMGCLRFSGQARAMDVGKIIQDQGWIIRNQGRFQSFVEGELHKMHEQMASLTGFLSSISRGVACEQL